MPNILLISSYFFLLSLLSFFGAKALSLLECSSPVDAGPVEDVEGEKEDREDDEEGEVSHCVVVFLPLRPIKLSQLHLEQNCSVPEQNLNQRFTVIGISFFLRHSIQILHGQLLMKESIYRSYQICQQIAIHLLSIT